MTDDERIDVEIEVADCPPISGSTASSVVDPLLSDSLLTGHVERVDDEDGNEWIS
jgi:hypothetical protein